ncbi:hypothetical protein KSP39_PZI021100 [Platanthera zijinensis]|uniref:Uncharacterized protein n=1 Tax=Platanthera zijinensis TaxID=2320716 RepID=A0AAP0AXJ3_9ASPA
MNRSIIFHFAPPTVHDIPCFSLRTASQWSRSAGPLRSSALLVPAVTYRRTSVPEAKEEEQEQQGVLSWPSSSATTTVVVANGDPPFRKVMGLAVRSKIVCHCCGADRFTIEAPLSNISGRLSICLSYIAPH